MPYKVIFRSDVSTQGPAALAWEAGCPVRVAAIQVSRDTQTGQAFLQTKVQNVSDSVIGSYHATFHVTFEDGSAQDVETHPLDADIAPRGAHEPQALALARGDVLSATGTVQEVRTSAGTWASSTPAGPVPTPATLVLSPEALAERAAQLAEVGAKLPPAAIERAVAVHDGWWLCPCGQPNVGRDTCCACEAPLSKLQTLEDEETLLKAAHERHAREKRSQELKAAEEQAKRKKSRRLAIGGSIAAGAVAVAFALWSFVISPAMRANELAARETARVAPYNETATGQGGWVRTKEVVHDPIFGGTSTTEYKLDEWGNPVEMTTVEEGDFYSSFNEDEWGNPVETVAAEEEGSHSGDDGNTDRSSRYEMTVDPSGMATEVARGEHGDIDTTIDAMDSAGRPTRYTRQYEGGEVVSYEVSYRDDGTIESVKFALQHGDRGLSQSSTTLYDASGWKTSRESSYSSKVSSYTYAYDDTGGPHEVKVRETLESHDPDFQSTNDIRYVLDDNGNVTQVYEYDKLVREYEYAYVENLSPWALAQSKLKQQ